MMDQQYKYSEKVWAQSMLVRPRQTLQWLREFFMEKYSLRISHMKYREMLLSPAYQRGLVALVVDEAHCVKTWGDEFRKSFSQIWDIRSLLPDKVRFLALTATATTEMYYVVTKQFEYGKNKTDCIATIQG